MNLWDQSIVRNIIAFGLFVNIVFNIILIPLYGITGAAIATTLGIIMWNLLGVYYVYKNQMKAFGQSYQYNAPQSIFNALLAFVVLSFTRSRFSIRALTLSAFSNGLLGLQ